MTRLWPAVLAAGSLLLLAGCAGQAGPAPGTSGPVTPGPGTASPPQATPSTPLPSTPNPAPGTRTVRVYFLDSNHARTGQEPLFRPVTRQVTPPALAAGALTALFAGPTAAEQAAGLTLVRSGTTGYTRLRISGGVAHVTLTGGCASGGSTMTIAGEIIPTLRQFASVSYVKIYAPDGTTARPAGAGDSLPDCLNP